MTSLKQRAANDRNAQLSTGPRTEEGQRRASINALKHGLTTPIESTPWASAVGNIEELLLAEGFAVPERHELALRMVEYERTMAFQRQRLMGQVSNQPPSGRISGQIKSDLDMAQHIVEEGLSLLNLGNSLARKSQKLLLQIGERQKRALTRDGADVLRSGDRYYRRAANQLIKQLKGMGGR